MQRLFQITIGVLGLQGDFAAHIAMFRTLAGVTATEVRTASELECVDALVIPGGESTTIGKLLNRADLMEPIIERAARGMPVFGTCAGLILMACEIEGTDQPRLGLLDISVARNAFGRQIASFEAAIPLAPIGDAPVTGVFIRAPFVSRLGASVRSLGEYSGRVVAVQSGSLLGIAFHPELTGDSRVHAYFAEMCRAVGVGK